MHELITIVGPTATGKTRLASVLAHRINGEIISADSRQVYRGMDLGTGKDLDDYIVEGDIMPHHLIDIAVPGEEYNVFRFQHDFAGAYEDILSRGKKAIMCGGTGMYLEAVIRAYDMKPAPRNEKLRSGLELLTDDELVKRLKSFRELHNITDTDDRERLIRAIEISENPGQGFDVPHILKDIRHHVFGISLSREAIREKISLRLKQRLDQGLADEVRRLLDGGISPARLEFYGLEYKFLTQYVTGKINHNDMFQRLNTAIHQFAKRQMTWFRRMEKKGITITWIDGNLTIEEKIRTMLRNIS